VRSREGIDRIVDGHVQHGQIAGGQGRRGCFGADGADRLRVPIANYVRRRRQERSEHEQTRPEK
jgi:hypothetical protein